MEPPPPQPTQLPLPLDPPDAAIPFPPPLVEIVIRPPSLWRRLPPDRRHQVRQTLIRICQEVLDDSK